MSLQLRHLKILVAGCVLCAPWIVFYHRSPPITDGPGQSNAVDDGRVRRLTEHLGNVAPKSVTERRLLIHNTSSQAWTLEGVRSDCGCLVQTLEPESIDPGASAVLTLSFTAPDSVGTIARKLFLSFREEHAPGFVIAISGFVEPWCYAMPQEVDFGKLLSTEDESPMTRAVVLTLRAGSRLDTARPPQTPKWLSARYVNSRSDTESSAGHSHNVTLQLTPVLRHGTHSGAVSGAISLRSADNPEERLTLPVRATFNPVLSAVPDRLFLGVRDAGGQFSTKVTIRDRRLTRRLERQFLDEQFRLTHDLGDCLVVAANSGEKPFEIDVECRFTLPDSARFLAGNLTVSTQDGAAVAIPITVKVRPHHSSTE